MSSNHDPALQQFLQDLQTHGAQAEPGQFTLDPHRAVAMLRAQGRLSQSGPLPLLSALYTHSQGGPIDFCRSNWKFSWAIEHGRLSPSVELLLGEASLEAQGVKLHYHDAHVRLSARGGPEAIERVFAAFWERLTFYPWKEPIRSPGPLLFHAFHDDVRVDFYPSPSVDPFGMIARPSGRFVQVLRGISYSRKWALPVDAIINDELSKSDFSMTVVPESERRLELEATAAELFREHLLREVESSSPLRLDSEIEDTTGLPLFARSCAYAVGQKREAQLAQLVGRKVLVSDVMGHTWSLDEVWSDYQREGKLLVVEARREGPEGKIRPERPVVRWAGQPRKVLAPLFAHLVPGDGYLYTLAVNEAERQRLASAQGERRLASISVTGETWSLLPWGDPDRGAELEFVGPRRARETFYLDSSAPKGLRLLRESPQPLDRAARELVLDGQNRWLVLSLISKSMEHCPPPRETLLAALAWASQAQPWDGLGLEELERVPLLELVDGGYASLERCRRWCEQGEPLAVLADRSTSLPAKLPLPLVLWDHPIFAKLGLPTREVGRLFRESHWKESGRARWLEAHEPGTPSWPPEPFFEFDGHRVAMADEPKASTKVAFWSEGRPFGSITLDSEACRPGFLVLWVEDELPGDAYWSGPDFAAIVARIPKIDELCEKAQALQ